MGEDWQKVPSRNHRRSNADDVSKVAKSVFVTNFSESISARDLWKSCSVYGTVVDIFIPSKKSKAGKRFTFVRFIKVFNLDRLMENLFTIWIGRYHLYANSVRLEWSHKSFLAPTANAAEVPKKLFVPQYSNARPGSYANVVNGASPGSYGSLLSTSPAMVLEDTCLVVHDLSKHVMGKVKDFMAILGLYIILKDEGFLDVIIRRWVKTKRLEMVGSKLDTIAGLEKIDKAMHIGVVDDCTVLCHQADDLERGVSRDERELFGMVEITNLQAPTGLISNFSKNIGT
nr:RNA-directed DNA polymerase, eukaryota, nucleotide-binding alpha-beta plait domain protein [Tanacetum cinerariifolium]